MAKAPKCTLVKKSAVRKAARAPHAPGGPVVDFQFTDNEDSTCTVQGVDAGGNPVDISSVATIAVTSSDPATVSVDPPSGMTFTIHGLKPSTAGSPVQITVTATWNDGSLGPFTFILPVDVTGTAATGLIVTPGTPVVRP